MPRHSTSAQTKSRDITVLGKSYPNFTVACREFGIRPKKVTTVASRLSISREEALEKVINGFELSTGPIFEIKENRDPSKLNNRIFNLRMALGETDKEFADRFNISLSSVSHWEVGRSKPNITILKEMAELADQSFEEFYFGK
ncbi:helix-turn-helix transcriptional regulator [Streptococcus hongkongensis]|nr:DNA-binding protein [Streptococcus uberis]